MTNHCRLFSQKFRRGSTAASGVGGFLGRGRALTAVLDWLNDPFDPRSLIVLGDPGSGKTALLRWVRVWDLASGTPVGTPFTGHTGIVSSLTLLPVSAARGRRTDSFRLAVVHGRNLSIYRDLTGIPALVVPLPASAAAVASAGPAVAIGAELGIVVLDLPS